MKVIVTSDRKLGYSLLRGRIPPTSVGVIIHLLSTVDIALGMFWGSKIPNLRRWPWMSKVPIPICSMGVEYLPTLTINLSHSCR